MGREVRVLMVLWFSEEYHHSRNCRKNTPMERLVERDRATPPTTVDVSLRSLSPTLEPMAVEGEAGLRSIFVMSCPVR